jgi:hypothetical protein
LQNFLLKTMFGKYSCSVKKGREGGGGVCCMHVFLV